jgi:hypothetical protein
MTSFMKRNQTGFAKSSSQNGGHWELLGEESNIGVLY